MSNIDACIFLSIIIILISGFGPVHLHNILKTNKTTTQKKTKNQREVKCLQIDANDAKWPQRDT